MTIACGPHHLAVGQVKPIGAAVAVETRDGAADRHLGAELLGLRQGAPGQRLAGDPGREAEVVLDARALARLSARRGGLEDQHVQPLRRGVDRCGQPGGPGADDHHVAHRLRIERGGQAQHRRQRFQRRVLEDVAAAAQDHRDLVDADVESVQHHLHARIGLDVLVGERLTVAAEEFLDVLGAARMARSEQDHVVAVLGRQRHPPQDEGAHQDLAQLRVALHQRAQVLPIDGDDRAVGGGARAHQAAPGRQHVDLAGELPGVVNHHRLLAIANQPDDLDRPRQHHEESRVLLPHLDQHLARADVAAAPDAADALDLRRRKLGEHLGGAVHHVGGHACT